MECDSGESNLRVLGQLLLEDVCSDLVSYAERVLRQNLLWHFSTWRLRQLRTAQPVADPCR